MNPEPLSHIRVSPNKRRPRGRHPLREVVRHDDLLRPLERSGIELVGLENLLCRMY
jgi:hypothetical protein